LYWRRALAIALSVDARRLAQHRINTAGLLDVFGAFLENRRKGFIVKLSNLILGSPFFVPRGSLLRS
jgi:hypothetical protein